MYKKFIKGVFDRVCGAVLLIASAPFLVILAALLYWDLKESPFFLQPRGGYKGSVFNIIKLKTMTTIRDASGNLLPDHERLSRIGSWVRKNSLDELPQLVNVVKGDMSFVGPRPFHAEYLELYSDHQARRHDVKPGITGWAQVKGRNSLSWAEKFEYDIWYVENVGFFLDMKILWLTVTKVLRREGVNQSENQTMEKFNGRN